jgi:putative Mn2+ efflux pump MntP
MLLEAEAGAVFPEDIDFTSASGSRAGGIVLIVVGFLFLMNTRYHWHFDWVEEWWPLGFMILGAYLIYKDMQARKEKESNTRDRKRDLEE